MIDKGFSSRIAMTFAAAIKLTRRAKHWQDVILARGQDRGVRMSAFGGGLASAGNSGISPFDHTGLLPSDETRSAAQICISTGQFEAAKEEGLIC
ncbi:hypothetical protein I3J27_10020 [Bradyrhizobium xenonodulans]|uniref:Uncharacterized protein n=1 Tax=Bradyrhizobium xenonodulans TaxID=2736875 RepID=A0ABY7MVV0_9BRAD|nr:hypothetical protein [Bradyrhizobium xenonodulans]WBL80732.1 hypothetical protein I3J27_10020 [Bradyrhizobium xenonodulans]